METGNKIGVTKKIGWLQDEDRIEDKMYKLKSKKWNANDDETPAGSDIENNPGEFLKELEPLYPKSWGIFDSRNTRNAFNTAGTSDDLRMQDFSKLTNEELQYMLSLMNEQYMQGIPIQEFWQSWTAKKK